LKRFLRHCLVWLLPGSLMLVVVVLGFVLWLLGTSSGTRLLLSTAVAQLDGQVEDVQGSVLDDLRVGHLRLSLPGTEVELRALRLDVDWQALWQRRAHVRELSADTVRVAQVSQPDAADEPPGEPLTELTLPVAVAVDRLALGAFSLTQDGQALPVSLSDLQARLEGGANGALLDITHLRVGHELAQADVQGTAQVSRLAAPWPFRAQLSVDARAARPDSPLCVDAMLAQNGMGASAGEQAAERTKPAAATATPSAPDAAADSASAESRPAAPPLEATLQASSSATYSACPFHLQADASGSLDAVLATLQANAGSVALAARAQLAPVEAFPLRSASLDLQRGGKPALAVTVDNQPVEGQSGMQRLAARLRAEGLDLSGLLGPGMPGARLSARLALDAEIQDMRQLRRADVALDIDEGSRWNGQPLSGKAGGHLMVDGPAIVEGGAEGAAAGGATPDAQAPAQTASPTENSSAPAPVAGLPEGWRVDGVDVDLHLGSNRIRAQGRMGPEEGALTLDALAPRLAAFWPGLPGGAKLQAKVDGTVARHRATLDAAYTPENSRASQLGSAPAQARLALEGGWGAGAVTDPATDPATGWRGTLTRLEASSAGFGVAIQKAMTLAYLPDAAAPAWQVQVGATVLALTFPDKQRIVLSHGGSRTGAGRWETAGQADNLVITAAMVRQLRAALDPASLDAASQSAASRVNAAADGPRRIALDLSWDLRFAGALAGKAHLSRRDGDLRIPGDPPIPLGLRQLVLDVNLTPAGGAASRLDAKLDLRTDKMGTVQGQANAVLSALAVDPRQPIRANLDADIEDLAWVGLFTGDSLEVGGKVNAHLQAQGTLAGAWAATGAVRGSKLRVVRVDDGVRLIDGTLDARLDGDRFILNSLRFPASLRVMPAEARTSEWITTNPDAKNGYVEASGQWFLSESRGNVQVKLHRFPALQRSDRYAMVSGTMTLDAELPRLTLSGDLTADAGWFSLEVLQGVPTLDDDVRVVRAGDGPAQPQASPMQFGMDVKFDMGPRFYITGMGLDAGLTGNIHVMMSEGRLSGMGALRTRGGGIEAYGQKLRLRRGVLTFQGRLDNPLLDVEALRAGGEAVEAGVKVTGTAQRPRIDLVSYPDVSDVEKLSWLVLGRGPDESGNDTALLLSVGAALLGGGQPFYKQFGLDDVSVRTGSLGSSGSVLPDRTVASEVNSDSDSDLATQFIVGSKTFSNGITLSVEQALAGSETVGRASYRLARGLSLDLKGGGVNGLALVYRVLWGN